MQLRLRGHLPVVHERGPYLSPDPARRSPANSWAAALPDDANWLTCRPMPTNLAAKLAVVSVCLTAGACVIPPATSPAGAPAAPTTPAAPTPSSAPAAVSEQDRTAALSRVDLLGGAGIAAFKLEGEAQKVDLAPVAIAGQPFTDAVRATIKEGSGHEWAVQLVAENA